MAVRVMYVQLKSGYDTDAGPAWISQVSFNRSWKTACWHGRTLAREQSWDANFVDIETGERFWLSGPKRNRTDGRYSSTQPNVDEDAREAYEAFLEGAALPGRENG